MPRANSDLHVMACFLAFICVVILYHMNFLINYKIYLKNIKHIKVMMWKFHGVLLDSS